MNYSNQIVSAFDQADVPSAPPEAHQRAGNGGSVQGSLLGVASRDWRAIEAEACARVKPGDPMAEINLANSDRVFDDMTLSNTLILMACGGTKRDVLPGQEIPLIDLYDGPMWQTLRTHLGDWYFKVVHGFTPAQVVVLSGKYGIIDAGTYCGTYEARLTKEKADTLIKAGILSHQDRFGTMNTKYGTAGTPLSAMGRSTFPRDDHAGAGWRGVVICGGSEYRRAFMALVKQLIEYGAVELDAPILATSGGIGEQRAQLGRWLQALRKNSGPCRAQFRLRDSAEASAD